MSLPTVSLPQGHAFLAMQNNFFGWLDRTGQQGHLTKGNISRAKGVFVDRFQKATLQTVSGAEQNYKKWIETAKKDGHITSGNARYMSKAVSDAYSRTLGNVLPSKPLPSAGTKPKKFEDVLKKAGVKHNDNLYKFFFDKKFKYLDKYYDLRIEDFIGVLWIDPVNKKEDNQFLQELNKKHPKEMLVLRNTKKFGGTGAPYIDLKDSTRFANNDTFSALKEFKNNGKVLDVVKKILKHGILNY